jgi:hypothetical protein
MRIYDCVVIDMTSGETLEARATEYAGPVAECKGGGSSSTTNTVDYDYNKRMATIAEEQQAMAKDYFDFWKSDYKPLEQAQIQANLDTLQQAAPAREKFIQESLDGVNGDTLAATARADAAQASATADKAASRALARYGINPDSGVFASTLGQSSSVDRARLAVQASNDARTKARQENYNRLATVAGLGLGS